MRVVALVAALLTLVACGSGVTPAPAPCHGDDVGAVCAVVSWTEPSADVEVHVIRDGASSCSNDDCTDDDCAFLEYKRAGVQVSLASADDPGEPFVVVVVARLHKTAVQIETAAGTSHIELTPNEARTVLSYPAGTFCDDTIAGSFDFACEQRAPPCD